MRIPTIMGAALFNAANHKPESWVSKQVVERATHTAQGTKQVKQIEVHVSQRTREKIASDYGVIV